jgi:hypothetical protein
MSDVEREAEESKPESVLAEAERVINGPKREAYGPVEESFERIAAGWSMILRHHVTARETVLCMVWLKVMREGYRHDRDNLVDIAGYAGLADQLAQ